MGHYNVTFLDQSGRFLFGSTNNVFLPNIGDEMRLAGVDLKGVFQVTRRIFTVQEGNQTTIPVTVYVSYRSARE